MTRAQLAAQKAVTTRRANRAAGLAPGTLRKPIGVWVLLPSGEQWMYCREATLDEALRTARTLRDDVPSLGRGPLPLLPQWRVWLAPPPAVALDASRARYRRRA